MSEYDRHFARRHITWKLTDVTRESLKHNQYTPVFSITLGDKKTDWSAYIYERNQHLGVFVKFRGASSENFSTRSFFSIMKLKPSPNHIHTRFPGKFAILRSGEGMGVSELISFDNLFDEKNQFLDANELIIDIRIEMIEIAKIDFFSQRNSLLEHNSKLFNNEKYSDFVFICSDGGKIHVHKSIISQCEAFATMIDAGLSETKTNSATITDVDSETMLELVRFLYSRQVNGLQEIQEKLLVAANKYCIEELKLMCVSSLMESLTEKNVFTVFEIAALLGEEHLKNNCIDYIKCYHFQLSSRLKKEDLSKELSWALWKSMDSQPTRVWFKNNGTW